MVNKKEQGLKELKKETDLKDAQRFNIRDLHTHVTMLLRKFSAVKTFKSKFYRKRGR